MSDVACIVLPPTVDKSNGSTLNMIQMTTVKIETIKNVRT